MIQQPGQTTAAESLAPPRPNLGPEPLGSDDSLPLLAPALLGGILIVAALVALWRWRRPSRRTAEPPAPPRDDSPEARLLALRARARTILAERFGPALRARTTEEVAADARLAETLGGDDLARLTDLLRAGDSLLFNHDHATTAAIDRSADLTAWNALLDALARSR